MRTHHLIWNHEFLRKFFMLPKHVLSTIVGIYYIVLIIISLLAVVRHTVILGVPQLPTVQYVRELSHPDIHTISARSCKAPAQYPITHTSVVDPHPNSF